MKLWAVSQLFVGRQSAARGNQLLAFRFLAYPKHPLVVEATNEGIPDQLRQSDRGQP